MIKLLLPAKLLSLQRVKSKNQYDFCVDLDLERTPAWLRMMVDLWLGMPQS